MSAPLLFSIQTMQVMRGRELRSVTPDKDGVYRNIPISVIGMPSRNNVLYNPQSYVRAMTDPNSRFNKSIVEGCLEGEWQHMIHFDDKTFVNRALTVDRSEVSHYFTKIWTKPLDGNNDAVIVYADIVPFGPRKNNLIESFGDPKRNTNFSLRAITGKPTPMANGIKRKDIVCMVTFDAVALSGYEVASKRYAVASESYQPKIHKPEVYQLDDSDVQELSIADATGMSNFREVVGFEAVECQELLDAFETNTLRIQGDTEVIGLLGTDGKTLHTTNGKKSLFHEMFSKGI